MFREALARCVENFGPSPRRIPFWDRLTYWRIVRPDWLYQNPNDELETIFLNLADLRKNGKVVWGHIVQANSLLHGPASGGDCPAEVVYALKAEAIEPEELGDIALALAALKHTQPDDPALAFIADHLTNEWTRVYGKRVPESLSPTHVCRISTIYVVRKHLPKGRLCAPLLPIIVNPVAPHVAIVLPARYWPKELVEWWSKLA